MGRRYGQVVLAAWKDSGMGEMSKAGNPGTAI